jgi:hypothetical protein
MRRKLSCKIKSPAIDMRDEKRFHLNAEYKLRAVLLIVVALIVLSISMTAAWAGPPFRTDDPEPVDYKHWEFYVATTFTDNVGVANGTAPQFEINYGILPNIQLHVITPFAFSQMHGGPTTHGFGDTEFGVKYRFVNIEDYRFMAGTFPLVEAPTGDSNRGLGGGHTMVYIPIWLQKSWGEWTTYGGGGWWRNPGADNKDYWFFGWELQCDLSKIVTLGAELFTQTKTTYDGNYEIGFNVGAIINITDDHHILFSVGRDFHGDNKFSTYLAYQYTFGPREEKK